MSSELDDILEGIEAWSTDPLDEEVDKQQIARIQKELDRLLNTTVMTTQQHDQVQARVKELNAALKRARAGHSVRVPPMRKARKPALDGKKDLGALIAQIARITKDLEPRG